MCPSACTACKSARNECTAVALTRKTTNACCEQRSVSQCVAARVFGVPFVMPRASTSALMHVHRMCDGSPGWVCRRLHCRRCTVPQCAATPAPCRMTAGPSGHPQHHSMMHSSTHTYAIAQRMITIGQDGTYGRLAACRTGVNATRRSRDQFVWLQTRVSTQQGSQSSHQRGVVALMPGCEGGKAGNTST